MIEKSQREAIRMYHWKPDMIRFMQDASARTDYYRLLAQQIAARVPSEAHVCDMGCGLGHLAMELAKRFRAVTAIDLSPAAIEAFRKRLEADVPPNLTILCQDAFTLPERTRFDAAVFCYFGSLEEILRLAKAYCTGTVVVVRRNTHRHRFDLDGTARSIASAAEVERTLAQRGVPFIRQEFEPEFGQPFRSVEDAALFFRTYRRGDPDAPVDTAQILPLLQPTNDPAFPYYLPHEKKLVLFSFSAADL